MFEDFVEISLGIFMDGSHYQYVGTGVYEHEILKDCSELNDGVERFSKIIHSWEDIAGSRTCQLLIRIDNTVIIDDNMHDLISLINGEVIKVLWDFISELIGNYDVELCTGKMLREVTRTKSKGSSETSSALNSLLNAADKMSN